MGVGMMRSRLWLLGGTGIRLLRRYFTTTTAGLLVELGRCAELRGLAGDLVGRAGSRLGAQGLWPTLWVLTELVLLQEIEGRKNKRCCDFFFFFADAV